MRQGCYCPDCDTLHVVDEPIAEDTPRASEALYMFAGWLTARAETIVGSRSHNAAPWAEAVDAFCKANNLSEPREGWEKYLRHPS